MITVPEQLPNVIDRALRTAYAEHTVTAVIVPFEQVAELVTRAQVADSVPCGSDVRG
ncbi:hypothetical protein [Streptomyces zaomyceticus]|uniref:hypothetical protein n=1 Tax=Streptomyces zaomyceticus TaxID=68286 RepID=UPI002E1B9F60